MRGQSPTAPTVDVLVRAVLDEFPELDPERLKIALERGIARSASTTLDTEAVRVVDLHLARAEATEEATERAQILRELAEMLEQRGDAQRAMVVRLAAFGAAPAIADLDPLLRLARITTRWSELPLDSMSALIDLTDEASPRRLRELAHAWQQVGRMYYAADCLERVLALDPTDAAASDALETFYRSTGEWPVLVDLLARRAVHVERPRDRAELLREMAAIYERELGDDGAALDAYQEAEQLEPGRPEVVEAIARLAGKVGLPEDEVLAAAERLAEVTTDPPARAQALCRAAELARSQNWDRAQALFERARDTDPDLVPAIDGLAVLLRDRGELAAAAALLVGAADRPALARERSRWLADAADFRVALGELEHAKQLYREARDADPANHRAAAALVELCWDTGSLVELAPILDELCRTTDDPERLRHYLLQRSKVAVELGEATSARIALTRAVDLDPGDQAARRELADLLYEAGEWERARPLIEGLLEDEDQLPEDERIELHYRVARCAHQLGDDAAAGRHAGIALALAPDHRPSLLLRAELDTRDPETLLADQLALANTAPIEERAARFAALGDRYLERGDRATAREMYREALSYKPHDHMLLTKSLNLVADDGDWSYSLDLLQRLMDSERDPKVRARYRHAAAQIARDELEDAERALGYLEPALDDDPRSFPVADDLEALLAAGREPEALVRFYYRRLDHVREAEGRPGERLRLWDKLGELCQQLGHVEDAVVAFEVGLSLAPDHHERRVRLADLYLRADPKHSIDAIVQHQAVLRSDKRRAASYEALRGLYARTGQLDKARACDDALTALAPMIGITLDVERQIDSLFDDSELPAVPGGGGPPRRPSRSRGLPGVADTASLRALPRRPRLGILTNDDWIALARLDVDLQLSALFALVAPAFAAERARMRPPPAAPARDHELPPVLDRVLGQVVATFGLARPAIALDREQAGARITMRVRDGVLVPVLVVAPALDGIDEPTLGFELARQLADLRNDRIARVLCPRPGELAQIVELATAQAGTAEANHAARWLAAALHPVELEQVRAIGKKLRERRVHPMTSAIGWLAATERAGDRIGHVIVGELGPCLRVLSRLPLRGADADRALELVWASVTEEVLAVRGRLEGWVNAIAA